MSAAGRATLAGRMSEKQLDTAVRRMMNDLGLSKFAFHPYGQGRYQEGYPDWTIAGPGGLLFRELKTERGQLTDAQRAFLERLQSLGQDAKVWRPSDLIDETIGLELARISGLVKKAV